MELKKIMPTRKEKGYSFYNSSQGSFNNDLVYALILAAKNSKEFLNLSKSDKDLLNVIEKTYREVILLNGEIGKSDLVLEPFEYKELLKIDADKHARYFVYRYKYKIFPLLNIQGDYPPCVQMEPTSVCNFRCVMCYQIDKSFSSKSKGHMGMMTLDNFKMAIDELEGNVEAISLASRGEPLLNPKMGEMLKYAGGKFLGLKMNTNASLLTEKRCHEILESGLNVLVFSADAAEKVQYEKIRVNGKFEQVANNVKLFSKIREQHYPDSSTTTKVSGVKFSKEQDFGELKDFWGEYCDEVAFVNYNPWESAYDNEENKIVEPCSELWRVMYLWWDGKVNPCDYDYKTTLFMGHNLTFPNMSIKDIWNSDHYNSIRQKHLDARRDLIEPCKRCVSV